nr:MAG TPA: hypothetical protein [Caudoviricetes sp.]
MWIYIAYVHVYNVYLKIFQIYSATIDVIDPHLGDIS